MNNHELYKEDLGEAAKLCLPSLKGSQSSSAFSVKFLSRLPLIIESQYLDGIIGTYGEVIVEIKNK